MPTEHENVTLTVDGRVAKAAAGSTVAVALLANGQTSFRRSVHGEPRGPLCGMGVCFECRVTIDGRPHQKSCQLPVAQGMEVTTDGEPRPFDICVVGGGAGGIAAAVTAAECGKHVGLVDDGPFLGGQIWRHRGEGPASRTARGWMRRLEAVSQRVTLLPQTRVVASPAPGRLLAEAPDGARILKWKSLILATGARELFLPFPGWTTPGVLGAGAMQALVKSGLPVTGKRVVVAGTGPLLLAVADLLRSRGAIVPMIAEQASACRIRGFALSLARTPSKLAAGAWLRARLLGAAYSTDSYVLGVVNQGPSLRVSVRRGNRQKTVDCDYLACGFHLIPNNELPQVLGCDLTLGGYVRADGRLRTTAPNVYAVGELTGIGGVDKAVIEGRIAAHTAVGDETAARSLARAHAASLHFAARLDAAFALRSELLQLARPDTVICRCEDVRAGAVSQWLSARDAKLQTRCGMGPCQGRTCGPVLERVFGAEPQGVRPPIFPVAVGTLAAGASEASA